MRKITAHFILYVTDQSISTQFYENVLSMKTTLNVPGMTEFRLNNGAILGLMPVAGIRELLGEKLPDPDKASGIPRSEVYLLVDDPARYHKRAIECGATELSALSIRNWGYEAAYSLDLDGHVLVFAKKIRDLKIKSLYKKQKKSPTNFH